MQNTKEQASWVILSLRVLSLPRGADGRKLLSQRLPCSPSTCEEGWHVPRAAHALPSRGRWGQRLGSPEGGRGLCRSVPRMGSGSCCAWVAAAGSGLTAALAPGSERTAHARDGPAAAGQS